MSQFHCDCCEKDKIHTDDSCSTGYATTKDGNKICFDCCSVRDRQVMIDLGNSALYLSKDEKGYKVTNWPGTLMFRCTTPRKGKHNIARTRYDVWFTGPDGQDWHGVQYGENTQIVHCKRAIKRNTANG